MAILEASNITTIITTYNDYTSTFSCLEKIYKQENIPQRIIVVDNGSENSYVDNLLLQWKELIKKINIQDNLQIEEPTEIFSLENSCAKTILLRLSKNEGYSKAINTAISLGLYDKDCQAFWILHNDTLPESYVLSALMNHTTEEKNSEIENFHIVGSTFLSQDPEILECAAGGYFSTFSGKITFYDENVSRYSLTQREKAIQEINFLYGASLLIKREVFESIGLFSEDFFLYYEDIDFSLRASKAGFKLNWAPGAIITHKSNKSRLAPVRLISQFDKEELSINSEYYHTKSRFYLLKKINPKSYYLTLINLFFPLLKAIVKGNKEQVKNLIKAAFDGFKL